MSQAITIKGLKEVQKALYSYSQQLGDRVVLAALRQGANLVKKSVQQQAPVKTGTLRRGFRVSKSRIHNGKRSSSMIGVYLTLRKGGGRKDKNDPFYGRWQESGWRNIPGKKFIARSLAATKEQAAQLIVAAVRAGAEVLSRKVGLR